MRILTINDWDEVEQAIDWIWFKELWEKTDYPHSFYELYKKTTQKLNAIPMSEREFYKEWDIRDVLAEDYEMAKKWWISLIVCHWEW